MKDRHNAILGINPSHLKQGDRSVEMWHPRVGAPTPTPIEFGYNRKLVQRHGIMDVGLSRDMPHLTAIQRVIGDVKGAAFEFGKVPGAHDLSHAWLVAGGERLSLPIEAIVEGKSTNIFLHKGTKRALYQQVRGAGVDAAVISPMEGLARDILSGMGDRDQPISVRMANIQKAISNAMMPTEKHAISGKLLSGGALGAGEVIGYTATKSGGAMPHFLAGSVLYGPGTHVESLFAEAETAMGQTGLGRGHAGYDAGLKMTGSEQGLVKGVGILADLQTTIRGNELHRRAQGKKRWERKARGVVLPTSTPEMLGAISMDYNKSIHHLRAAQSMRQGDLARLRQEEKTAQVQGAWARHRSVHGSMAPMSIFKHDRELFESSFNRALKVQQTMRPGRTTTVIRSAGMDMVDAAATAHARLQGRGMRGMGKFQTATHLNMLALVPSAAVVQAGEKALLRAEKGLPIRASDTQAINKLRAAKRIIAGLGDSAAFSTSSFGMKFTAINTEWSEKVLPMMQAGPGAKKGFINPSIGEALNLHLAGSEGFLSAGSGGFEGLTYDQVTEAAKKAGPEFYGLAAQGGHEGYEGLLGYHMTTKGEIRYKSKPVWDSNWVDPKTGKMVGRTKVMRVPSAVRMKPGSTIQGMAVGGDESAKASLQLQNLRLSILGEGQSEGGKSFLGDLRRFGDQGHWDNVGGVGGKAIDFVHGGHSGFGGLDIEAGSMFYTAVDRANSKRGGLNVFRRALEEQGVKGLSVGSTSVEGGGVERHLSLPDNYLDPNAEGFLWRKDAIQKATAAAEKKLGIDLSPERLQIGPLAAHIARQVSTKEYPVSASSITEILEGLRYATPGRNRGGMWERGQIGAVKMRLDDVAGFAVSTMRAGGKQVKLPGGVKKTVQTIKGAEGWLSMMQSKVRGAASPWWSYQQGILQATHIGEKPLQWRPGTKAGTNKVVTLAQYQEAHRAIGKIPRGAGVEALDGMGITEMVNGQRHFTNQSTLVKLPGEVMIPFNNVMGGEGLKSEYAVMPSGMMFGQSEDEVLRGMSSADQKTLQGYGRKLHNALMSGDIDAIHVAQGEFSLKARAAALGKGGMLRKESLELTRSITGTIASHAGLEIGQVGVTVENLKNMGFTPQDIARTSKRSGFSGKGLIRRLGKAGFGMSQDTIEEVLKVRSQVLKGTVPTLKLLSKAEPALDAYHFSSHEVVPLSSRAKVTALGGIESTMGQHQGLAYSSYELPNINRDKDYDFMMAFLGSDPGNRAETDAEQLFIEDFHRSQAKRRKAMMLMSMDLRAKELEGLTANMGRTIENSAYHEMMDNQTLLNQTAAKFGINDEAGKKVLGERLWAGRAQAIAQAPQDFTGFMNLRWKKARDIVAGVAAGHSIDQFIFDEGVDLADDYVRRAFSVLSEEKVNAVALLDVWKASEYEVLKKLQIEQHLPFGTGSMQYADTQLHASFVASGQFAPGSEGSKNAINRLTDNIFGSLEGAQGSPLMTEAYERSGTFSPAIQREVARDAATQMQSLSYLVHATGSNGRALGMTSPIQLLRGRDPSHVMGARHFGAEAALSGAYGWQGGTGPATFSMGREAAMAGDEALATGATKTMGARALDAVDGGGAILRKMWASKWGKAAIGTATVLGVAGLGKTLFGSEATSPGEILPPGAQLPPPPMLDGVQESGIDFQGMPQTSFGRVERVPGVRTHLSVSGTTSGHDVSFMSMADSAFGRLGIRPRHQGFVQTDATSPLYRHQLEGEIRDRMNSSF